MRRGTHGLHTARVKRIQPDAIANLSLWLKADQISGLSDGDPVTTWSDQSGNGYDATQATVAHKPTYKTAIRNGLAVVRFDGSDDHLELSNSVGPTKEHTFFAVATDAGASNINVLIARRYNSTLGLSFRFNNNTQRYFAQAVNWVYFDSFCAAAVAWNVNTFTYNGSSMEIFCNGRNPRSRLQSGDIIYHADDDWSVGAGTSDVNYQWNIQGDIAELILYSIALAPHQMRGVEAYLGDKWGIRQ